jgi:hypothetical protein
MCKHTEYHAVAGRRCVTIQNALRKQVQDKRKKTEDTMP